MVWSCWKFDDFLFGLERRFGLWVRVFCGLLWGLCVGLGSWQGECFAVREIGLVLI